MLFFRRYGAIFILSVFLMTPLAVQATTIERITDSEPWPVVAVEIDPVIWFSLAGESQFILSENDFVWETFGYCVELEQDVYSGAPYEVDLTPVKTLSNGIEAAWLVNEFAVGLGKGPANPTSEDSMYAEAALQLAIWDTIYGDDLTMAFALEPILNLYNGYIDSLQAAQNSGVFDTFFADDFSIAHHDQYQDFLVYKGDPSAAVPEPSTISLMVIGLLLLFIIIDRQKRMGLF